MKKTIYTLFALFLAQQTWAQDIDKIITKPYVDRLIKTLSSDEMQGRATFSPGIDKAASFIEAEFKSIGLKPLEGNTFRQSFFQQKLKPISTKVTIDGKEIAASNVLVYGNTVESLVFDKASSAGWVKLDPEKPLMGQIRSLSKENKKQLVLVDPKFAESFNRVRDYLAGGTDLDEKKINEPSAALVLVLGEETVANDFKVEVKSKLEKLSLFNVAGVIPGKIKNQRARCIFRSL
jgi:hypothetical protein